MRAGIVSRLIPITTWLPRYSRKDLHGDLTAGLTVGVMLIPQGMAYALLAGMPPIYGLYASVVPLLIYTFLGTSRHLAAGTVAIDMMIIAVGVGALADAGSQRYIELVVLLGLMVGTMQVVLGLSRMGFVVILLSRPVIAGFTSAAALIIAFSQLGNLLGLALPQSSNILMLIWNAVRQLGEVDGWSLGIGLGGIGLIFGLKRWQWMPGPLAAVILGTLLAWGLGLEQRGVEVVGAIPGGLPAPQVPQVEVGALRALLPTALTLVLVQFMSVTSLGKVFAARHDYSIQASQELIAIGAANALGSFFRSIPVSGSFSRTALNEQAGARSPLANTVAAVLIAITLLALTSLFYHLPIPILASIIVVAVLGLFDVKELRYLLRVKRIEGMIAILTFGATLLVGIQEGILLGVMASVLGILYRIGRPRLVLLGHLAGTRSFLDVDRYPDAHQIPGILIVRVNASFSYVNADLLKDFLLETSMEHEARAVIIDASTMNDLDLTASAMLISVAKMLGQQGIFLYFSGAKGSAAEVMERSGLVALVGRERFFYSIYLAVKHILTEWGEWAQYAEGFPDVMAPSEEEV